MRLIEHVYGILMVIVFGAIAIVWLLDLLGILPKEEPKTDVRLNIELHTELREAPRSNVYHLKPTDWETKHE